MTRAEAIKVLSSYDVNGVWADVDGKPYNAEEQAEAFDMAIEALKGAEINCAHCPRYFETEDETGVHSHCEDLISRAEAIEALGEEPPVWCDEEYEIAERSQWRADVEAIKSVPSADRPTDEFDGMIFSTDKYMAFIDKKEIHIMRKGACKVTMERIFNTEEDEE